MSLIAEDGKKYLYVGGTTTKIEITNLEHEGPGFGRGEAYHWKVDPQELAAALLAQEDKK